MASRDYVQEIEDILVDCYDEDERMEAWAVAFEDRVALPFRAVVFGVPVEVRGFRNEAGCVQCLAAPAHRGTGEPRAGAGRERWIGVDALDPEDVPADLAHVMDLYQAWRSGTY